MHVDETAIVSVVRETGQLAWPFSLHVYIDGKLVTFLRPKQTHEFEVPAGNHVVAATLSHLAAEPVNVELKPEEYLELTCTTNQPPLHPLHVHFIYLSFLFGAVCCVGFFVPAIKKFVDEHLVAELIVGMGLGLIGMFIHFRKLHKANAWHPEIFLRRKQFRVETDSIFGE